MSDRGKLAAFWKRWGIAVADGALIIALIVIAIYVNCGRRQGEAEEPLPVSDEGSSLRDVLAYEEPVAPEPEKESAHLPAGNYQITMTTKWTFPDAQSPAEDSYVENVPANLYDVDFTVVLASDESKILYSSPVLPVGSYTAGIKLHEELDPGTYACVVIYTLYATEGQYAGEAAGTVRVALTVEVQ